VGEVTNFLRTKRPSDALAKKRGKMEKKGRKKTASKRKSPKGDKEKEKFYSGDAGALCESTPWDQEGCGESR